MCPRDVVAGCERPDRGCHTEGTFRHPAAAAAASQIRPRCRRHCHCAYLRCHHLHRRQYYLLWLALHPHNLRPPLYLRHLRRPRLQHTWHDFYIIFCLGDAPSCEMHRSQIIILLIHLDINNMPRYIYLILLSNFSNVIVSSTR